MAVASGVPTITWRAQSSTSSAPSCAPRLDLALAAGSPFELSRLLRPGCPVGCGACVAEQRVGIWGSAAAAHCRAEQVCADLQPPLCRLRRQVAAPSLTAAFKATRHVRGSEAKAAALCPVPPLASLPPGAFAQGRAASACAGACSRTRKCSRSVPTRATICTPTRYVPLPLRRCRCCPLQGHLGLRRVLVSTRSTHSVAGSAFWTDHQG